MENEIDSQTKTDERAAVSPDVASAMSMQYPDLPEAGKAILGRVTDPEYVKGQENEILAYERAASIKVLQEYATRLGEFDKDLKKVFASVDPSKEFRPVERGVVRVLEYVAPAQAHAYKARIEERITTANQERLFKNLEYHVGQYEKELAAKATDCRKEVMHESKARREVLQVGEQLKMFHRAREQTQEEIGAVVERLQEAYASTDARAQIPSLEKQHADLLESADQFEIYECDAMDRLRMVDEKIKLSQHQVEQIHIDKRIAADLLRNFRYAKARLDYLFKDRHRVLSSADYVASCSFLGEVDRVMTRIVDLNNSHLSQMYNQPESGGIRLSAAKLEEIPIGQARERRRDQQVNEYNQCMAIMERHRAPYLRPGNVKLSQEAQTVTPA